MIIIVLYMILIITNYGHRKKTQKAEDFTKNCHEILALLMDKK